MKKRVLLLNPPGKHIYFRDYYCPKRSKAHYYYHPLDLVYLSGRFNCTDFDLTIIDAIAMRQSSPHCLAAINAVKPDYIVSLFASVSFEEDRAFLQSVKTANPQCTVIVSGDVCREQGEKLLNDIPYIDALLLDFSTDSCIVYCNRTDDEPIVGVIDRFSNQFTHKPPSAQNKSFDAPLPRWELFNLKQYSYPFARRTPFASVLTDYGCPFGCIFCPTNTLGFKLRPIDAVLDELTHLTLLGVKEIFFRDQTFGANKNRTLSLLHAMADRSLHLSFSCFSRADVLTEELVSLMRAAGCHTVIIGIESAAQSILDHYHKGILIDRIKPTVARCHRLGVRVAGTFIIGLPGETMETSRATISFATTLDLDYASFNVAAPLPGSQLRKDAITNNWIKPENLSMDSAIEANTWNNTTLSNDQINLLRKKALRSFYLRPCFLLKKLFSIRSTTELIETLKTAQGIFFPS